MLGLLTLCVDRSKGIFGNDIHLVDLGHSRYCNTFHCYGQQGNFVLAIIAVIPLLLCIMQQLINCSLLNTCTPAATWCSLKVSKHFSLCNWITNERVQVIHPCHFFYFNRILYLYGITWSEGMHIRKYHTHVWLWWFGVYLNEHNRYSALLPAAKIVEIMNSNFVCCWTWDKKSTRNIFTHISLKICCKVTHESFEL